jgi:integrase/recombinase XerD
MKTLSDHLQDYLRLRRQLGFKFYQEGSLLGSFIRFAREQRAKYVTTKLALWWAMLPANARQRQRALRLSAVRGFADYLKPREPRTEVPPEKLIPFRAHRPEPYLYSDQQVLQLINAARQIEPQTKIKGLTLSTLLGLLSVTGIRVGEALALERQDVDFDQALLLVRWGKGGKSRLVPIHASTVEALQRYAQLRDELYPQPIGPRFFLWTRGAPLRYQATWKCFRVAAFQAGLRPLGGGRGGYRIHDLRHGFAVRMLLNWYRSDVDVNARLPELSAFLGHVHVSGTYWYLSAVPELLQLATNRWERQEKGGK